MNTAIETMEPRVLLSGTPTINFDGGDSTGSPANIGRVSGALIVNDGLAGAETGDFYRFSVRAKGNVNLELSGLSADANLRLYDSAGNTVATSARTSVLTESIGRTLNKGTYIVSVLRASAAADTTFSLRIQADLNSQRVDIDGRTYTLGLIRTDQTAAAISTSKETWVVIHGWQSSPAHVHALGVAIDASTRRDQVLEVEWSEPADDANIVAVVGRVPEVANWVAGMLESWGIPGLQINLIGHSMGGYMTDEIGRRISGGVDRIVALDPGGPALGGIDLSDTDFAAHSQFSLAFLGSEYATSTLSFTADETIKLDVGNWMKSSTHSRVRDLFTSITNANNSSTADRISPLFSLKSLHTASRPGFTEDAFDGQFEAILSGSDEPTLLKYKSVRTGRIVNWPA